ncbi:hypothetical protein R5R35_006151 [Gryllus longicercus]|uniref:Uncharacterized protein n=1 Tax=Gryllus longicercus TaxID=2509291 RepID=A0AAN9Z6L4_9ORTH
MDETDIDDHESEPSGTSAVLNYCKKKILQPYLQLLSAMGLRPVRQELSGHCRISSVLYYIYFIFVLMLLIAGYILQGMACFRRDRGFCYKVSYKVPVDTCQNICYGNVTFSYVVPSVLHFTAYLYAVYLFRIMENEQLQNLMERAFLMASNNADGTVHQRHLMKRLWLFILLSLLWIALSVTSLSVMMAKEKIIFVWFEESSVAWTTVLKVLLMIGTTWHDLVNVTIITSYFLQAQLLISYLHTLKLKLLENSIPSLDWLREIGTFQKLLEYLNDEFAPSVCLFAIVNITRATSGIIWLLNADTIDTMTLHISGISILNVLLWVCLSIAPFVQAARLTSICKIFRQLGHEVRGRPFVYVDTPGDTLDTILLYTSSLRMTAKLYEIPISGRCICLGLTVCTVILLTLGQSHFF